MAYRLDPQVELGVSVRRVTEEQVDRAIDQLTNGTPDPDEAIHSARKRFKRIRAVLRLIRAGVHPQLYLEENETYRDLARILAPFRDRAAAFETLDDLQRRFGANLPDTSKHRDWLTKLRERVSGGQGGGHSMLGHMRAVAQRLETARGRIGRWPMQSDFESIAPGMQKIHQRGRKMMRLAAAAPSDEILHEWRKLVKYHWHHTLLVEESWTGPLHAYQIEAKVLADQLGAHHDLTVFQATLGDPAETGGQSLLEPLLPFLKAQQLELEQQVLALGTRIYAERSRDFTSRIGRYWRAAAQSALPIPPMERSAADGRESVVVPERRSEPNPPVVIGEDGKRRIP